jgi:hypothetical protein
MALSATDRERNYVQAKVPGREREFCYGLKYLTGPQLRRIRHKIHRRWQREGARS